MELITTFSWEDGIKKLKMIMDEEKDNNDIVIYFSEKPNPSMYKKNISNSVTIICYGNFGVSELVTLKDTFRSLLTSWYDLHDKEDEDEQYACNSRPYIHYISKSTLHEDFEAVINMFKDDLKYIIYNKGNWYI